MAEWIDGYWSSGDGLRLHYRDYAGDSGRPPIVCIPGLTRNARDWENVAQRLAGDWRLIVPELRGRGESAFAKDPLSYTTATYLGDLQVLLGAAEPGRVQGILVNDVGPELDEGGLARIRSYVGRASTWPTWMHAARELAEAHRGAFPDWKLEDWLIFAKRMGRLNNSGRIVLDYDLRIAEAFRMANPVDGFDMWGALNALKDVPMAVVRGETSDILSEATLARMRQEHPDLEAVTIPRIGHAPTLDEPEARAAISRLLAKVEERLELV